jgi:hypothetical protein
MADLIGRRFHRLGTQLSGLSRIAAMSLSLMMTPRYGKWSSNTWKITMSRRNLRQTGQSSIAILRGRLLA